MLKNDDFKGKGTFMLVKNVEPPKIMEQNPRSLNSFYNFPEPTESTDVVTTLVCFYKN